MTDGLSFLDLLGDPLPQLKLLLLVGIAAFLGGVVGIEREIADKPAGLRTHMIVAAAAALLVGLSDTMVTTFSQEVFGEQVRPDPIRILEAIITGISFLGAGTIIQRRREKSVEGLTTAASLLLTTAVGAAVALQQMVLAVGGTVLTLITLRMLHWLEDRLDVWRERWQQRRERHRESAARAVRRALKGDDEDGDETRGSGA